MWMRRLCLNITGCGQTARNRGCLIPGGFCKRIRVKWNPQLVIYYVESKKIQQMTDAERQISIRKENMKKPNPDRSVRVRFRRIKLRITGVEPAWSRPHMDLNHARLPIPPYPQLLCCRSGNDSIIAYFPKRVNTFFQFADYFSCPSSMIFL